MINNVKTLVDILIILLIVLTLLFSIYRYLQIELEKWFKTPEGMFDKYFFRGKINYISYNNCVKISNYIRYTKPINIRNYLNIYLLKQMCKQTKDCETYTIYFEFSNIDSLPDKIPILYNDVDTFYIEKTSKEVFLMQIRARDFFEKTGLTCEDFK